MPAAPLTVTTINTAASLTSTFTDPPLTTIFAPPTSCFEAPYTLAYKLNGTTTFVRNYYNWQDNSASACYPSNLASLGGNYLFSGYSPGVCPSGYTGQLAGSANNVQTSLCCLSGQILTTAVMPGFQECLSVLSTTTIAMDSGTTITATPPAIFYDRRIIVIWASSDLSSFSPVSAPLLAASQPTASTAGSTSRSDSVSSTSTSVSSNDINSTPVVIIVTLTSSTGGSANSIVTTSFTSAGANAAASSSSSSLTGGEIAGIVIGAIVGIALILAAVFFVLWRKKKAGRASNVNEMDGDTTKSIPVAELDSQNRPHELTGSNQHPQELETNTRAELPAK